MHCPFTFPASGKTHLPTAARIRLRVYAFQTQNGFPRCTHKIQINLNTYDQKTSGNVKHINYTECLSKMQYTNSKYISEIIICTITLLL